MPVQTNCESIIPARYVQLLAWAGAVLLGLLIPLKILQLGYIPTDDATRHVAKAISGKPWNEILVMDERFAMDEHPGWHATLGVLHRTLNLDADTLIMVSVALPFLAFWLAMLAGRRRPEGVLLALFVASLTAPGTFGRLLFGRPFIVWMVVYVVVLRLWTRDEKVSPARMTLTALLISLATWMHGSWYLFGFVLAGFALAGQWRKTVQLAFCWGAGVLLGAMFTGHPFAYLHETGLHLFNVFGGPQMTRFLVTELRPDPGDLFLVTALLLALLWRVARGDWKPGAWRDPLLVLAALGWLLGLKVSRFWTDWGTPAALLWLAAEVDAALAPRLDWSRIRPLALTGFVAAGVFISSTRDLGGRWSSGAADFVTPQTKDIEGWLPESGGWVYSSELPVFFRMFYKNPHADWRYVLGFEPGIMRPEDFAVLRNIQLNWFAAQSYEPWVSKMRPQDRLILLQGKDAPPTINVLEWHFTAPDIWIGRTPRSNTSAARP